MPKNSLSISNRTLSHKLLILYALMFLLPGGFLLFVIWDLMQVVQDPESTVRLTGLSLRLGIPAAVLMSCSAFLLMYRSMHTIRKVTEEAGDFYREMHGAASVPADVTEENDEVQRISHYVTDMIGELRRKINDVDQYAQDLDQANKKLMEVAVVDGMTQLYNHKHIRNLLITELRRAERFSHPLGIMMIDIDDFKTFNDTYGHLVGDRALRDVSRIIRNNVRTVDVPARYGGEEFLVILPEATIDGGVLVAERVRQAVEEHVFDTGRGIRKTHVTVSIGVGAYEGAVLTDSDLISQADARLYEAKRSGKNKVIYTDGA
ncbi:MAG: GGDEF domain-containing protein [Verrucomicrobia bacterium]|mgnify:CR=1 FL=1|jgi:diguanylate cyclase (GGDEF)-like protein|nr:GGDEF domain-containing protein [Verrucomicrobiota bacterium]MBT7067205.1 GGDEF domain-containing protein [Verrucomicrobiota bacterium]MBT7700493.1 GGDEF domain-containing protein [Verrucomicrobiota bacterium]